VCTALSPTQAVTPSSHSSTQAGPVLLLAVSLSLALAETGPVVSEVSEVVCGADVVSLVWLSLAWLALPVLVLASPVSLADALCEPSAAEVVGVASVVGVLAVVVAALAPVSLLPDAEPLALVVPESPQAARVRSRRPVVP